MNCSLLSLLRFVVYLDWFKNGGWPEKTKAGVIVMWDSKTLYLTVQIWIFRILKTMEGQEKVLTKAFLNLSEVQQTSLLWRAHWKDLESCSSWFYRENGQNLDINSTWSVENKWTKITTKKPVYHRYWRTEPLQDENGSLSAVYKEWRKVRDVFLLYSLDHFCILGLWVENFACKFVQTK